MAKESTGGDVVKHEKLAGAICAIMAEVGVVQMTGKLPVGGGRVVDVASVADIAKAIQPLMAKHGVVTYPHKVEYNHEKQGKTSRGADMFRTDLVIEWQVRHRDSDEMWDVATFGQGTDTGDKAGYKAMTGNVKYLHRLLFNIATEHDPDATGSEETTGGNGDGRAKEGELNAIKDRAKKAGMDAETWGEMTQRLGLTITRATHTIERMVKLGAEIDEFEKAAAPAGVSE